MRAKMINRGRRLSLAWRARRLERERRILDQRLGTPHPRGPGSAEDAATTIGSMVTCVTS